MRSFLAAVSIRATKEQIWPILADLGSYPEWNPVIERLEGHLVQGAHLVVHPKDPYQNSYRVHVEQIAEPKKMVWKRAKPFGAFVATRTFLLRTLKDGAVEFEMRETYGGWLARWIRPLLPDPQRSFEIFAVALKHRVEASVGEVHSTAG